MMVPYFNNRDCNYTLKCPKDPLGGKGGASESFPSIKLGMEDAERGAVFVVVIGPLSEFLWREQSVPSCAAVPTTGVAIDAGRLYKPSSLSGDS